MTIAIETEELRRKYRGERDKRQRPDGIDQYIRIADQFPEYLTDPYLPVVPREPKTDHVTFALAARLCRDLPERPQLSGRLWPERHQRQRGRRRFDEPTHLRRRIIAG